MRTEILVWAHRKVGYKLLPSSGLRDPSRLTEFSALKFQAH